MAVGSCTEHRAEKEPMNLDVCYTPALEILGKQFVEVIRKIIIYDETLRTAIVLCMIGLSWEKFLKIHISVPGILPQVVVGVWPMVPC